MADAKFQIINGYVDGIKQTKLFSGIKANDA